MTQENYMKFKFYRLQRLWEHSHAFPFMYYLWLFFCTMAELGSYKNCITKSNILTLRFLKEKVCQLLI